MSDTVAALAAPLLQIHQVAHGTSEYEREQKADEKKRVLASNLGRIQSHVSEHLQLY